MTRPLTENDLRVERDQLLEHGRTRADVQRMQLLADGTVLLDYMTLAISYGLNRADVWTSMTAEQILKECEATARKLLGQLSPAETPAGAQPPRPASLGGETP